MTRAESHKNEEGFSLIELMVVVAIIGILATIAVPQANKFMAKARQAEAKSNLSGLYTANKAFYTEYNSYYDVFQVIGYAPEGRVRYQTGFPMGAASPVVSGYSGPTVGHKNSIDYCNANATKCTVLNEGTSAAALGGTYVATISTFLAGAKSRIVSSSLTDDEWSINESKMITQVANGID